MTERPTVWIHIRDRKGFRRLCLVALLSVGAGVTCATGWHHLWDGKGARDLAFEASLKVVHSAAYPEPQRTAALLRVYALTEQSIGALRSASREGGMIGSHADRHLKRLRAQIQE